jgi:hypothetical protein
MKLLATAAATALFSVACGMSTPTSPSVSTSAASNALASSSGSVSSLAPAQVSCTIDIGDTNRPLPALHELADWINASLASSSLSCGQVRSLAAKLQQEVAALDQPEQNFDGACGASSALLNELQALTSTGSLSQLTFPPPVPGAPTTVLGLAELTNDHFCVAAHE